MDNKILININKKIKLMLYIIAFILMGAPVFFLENELLAGVFNILSIVLFLVLSKLNSNKKEDLLFLILLYLGSFIRFSTLLGLEPLFILAMALCFIPFSLYFFIVLKLGKYLRYKRKYILELMLFPLFYTFIMMILVLFRLGNEINVITYIMLIPKISNNIYIFKEFGLTFILCLFISLLVEFIVYKNNNIKKISLIGLLTLIISLCLIGFLVNNDTKEPDYYLNIEVAVEDEIDFVGNEENEYTFDEKLEFFKNAIINAKRDNADLLVLSEEYLTVSDSEYDDALLFYKNTIKEYEIPVLACFNIEIENEKWENNAIFFDKDGSILSIYNKRNLVPFIEAPYYKRSNDEIGYLTYNFSGHLVNISYVICFDINNSFYINKINKDTELLIVPSWDWDSGNIEQLRTRIRSIETNTTILKHSYNGITYVSSPYDINYDKTDFRGQYIESRLIKVPIYEK